MFKKIILMFFVIFICSCGKTIDKEEVGNEIFIPIISKGYQHQFLVAVKTGAEQVALDYGVTCSALLAVKGSGETGTVIIGYDSGKLLTDGIREGFITGAINSRAYKYWL